MRRRHSPQFPEEYIMHTDISEILLLMQYSQRQSIYVVTEMFIIKRELELSPVIW